MKSYLSEPSLPSFELHQFKRRETKYCILIPVLNEADRIRTQLEKMNNHMQSFDTLIVDGGSTDGSTEPEKLRSLGVTALIIKTGEGKLSAQIRLGLAYILDLGYEGAILMDGNNKDGPEALESFAQALDNGFDHIQGSRFIRGGREVNNPRTRILAIRWIHAPLISLAAGFRYTDTTNGFRGYSRRFLTDDRVLPFRRIFQKYELHYYLAIRAARLSFKVVEIPVVRAYPKGEPTPTKIKGFRGNFGVLKTLLKACIGHFNPKDLK